MLTFALICWLFFAVWLAAMVALHRLVRAVILSPTVSIAGISAKNACRLYTWIYWSPPIVALFSGQALHSLLPEQWLLVLFLGLGWALVLPMALAIAMLSKLGSVLPDSATSGENALPDRRTRMAMLVGRIGLMMGLNMLALAITAGGVPSQAAAAWIGISLILEYPMMRRSMADYRHTRLVDLRDAAGESLQRRLAAISDLFGDDGAPWRVSVRYPKDETPGEIQTAADLDKWAKGFKPGAPQLLESMIRLFDEDTLAAVACVAYARTSLARQFGKTSKSRDSLGRFVRSQGPATWVLLLALVLLAVAVFMTGVLGVDILVSISVFIAGMVAALLVILLLAAGLATGKSRVYTVAFEAWRQSRAETGDAGDFVRSLYRFDIVRCFVLNPQERIRLTCANADLSALLRSHGLGANLMNLLSEEEERWVRT